MNHGTSDWFLGILKMAYYNPFGTGWYYLVYTANKNGLVAAQLSFFGKQTHTETTSIKSTCESTKTQLRQHGKKLVFSSKALFDRNSYWPRSGITTTGCLIGNDPNGSASSYRRCHAHRSHLYKTLGIPGSEKRSASPN